MDNTIKLSLNIGIEERLQKEQMGLKVSVKWQYNGLICKVLVLTIYLLLDMRSCRSITPYSIGNRTELALHPPSTLGVKSTSTGMSKDKQNPLDTSADLSNIYSKANKR